MCACIRVNASMRGDAPVWGKFIGSSVTKSRGLPQKKTEREGESKFCAGEGQVIIVVADMSFAVCTRTHASSIHTGSVEKLQTHSAVHL